MGWMEKGGVQWAEECKQAVVWCGVVWCGVHWSGMVWYGVVTMLAADWDAGGLGQRCGMYGSEWSKRVGRRVYKLAAVMLPGQPQVR